MDELTKLVVKIIADTKEYAGGLKEASGQTSSFVGKAVPGLGKAGGAMALLGTAAAAAAVVVVAALAAVGAAIVAIGLKAFAMSQETDAAMRQLQAETGATDEEMVALKQTTLDLYNAGLGESIGDVAKALSTVKQITGESGEELENLTGKALIMRDVFDKDIKESVRAVDTAIEVFGTTGSQVFDLMTATIQRTGDPADDLLDTINEYSPDFKQMGLSAEQMFGILESGLQAGARNFDVVADAVREFSIRLVDGSATTENALNQMFEAVGEGSAELAELQQRLADTEAGLEANKAALEEAKGAYAASKEVVDNLSRALGEARRELNELSNPNLAGMQEFDDQLFELEQQSKQAKLALLDLTPDTDQYNAAKESLDAINKEMDKVSLQRDLAFDRQLRDIEKAATEGLEPITTYDEAMSQIGAKKAEIAGLEDAFNQATGAMNANKAEVDQLTAAQDYYTQTIANIKQSIAEADTPAKQFLAGLSDGSMSGAEAMSEIITKLKEIDDAALQEQIGVALFGSKFEELGIDIIASLDPAKLALEGVAGATDAAGQKVSEGFGPAWEKASRTAMTALIPLGDTIGEVLTEAQPYLEQFAAWMEVNVPIAVEYLKTKFDEYWPIIKQAIVDTWVVVQPVLLAFWNWLNSDGPGVLESFKTVFEEKFGFITEWVDENWPLMQETVDVVMTNIRDTVVPIIEYLVGFWERNGDTIMENVELVWGIVSTIIDTYIHNVLDVITLVMQIITGDWEGAWETIKGIIDRNWEAMKTIVGNVIGIILNNISIWLNEAKALFTSIWQSIVDTVGEKVGLVKEKITNKIEEVKTFLSELPGKFMDYGRDAIQGFIDGAKELADDLVNSVTEPVNEAIQGAKDLLGIKSPSKVFADMGLQMGAGLEQGVGAAIPKVQGVLSQLVQPPSLPGFGELGLAGASAGAGGGNITIEAGAIVINAPGGNPNQVEQASRRGVLSALREVGER